MHLIGISDEFQSENCQNPDFDCETHSQKADSALPAIKLQPFWCMRPLTLACYYASDQSVTSLHTGDWLSKWPIRFKHCQKGIPGTSFLRDIIPYNAKTLGIGISAVKMFRWVYQTGVMILNNTEIDQFIISNPTDEAKWCRNQLVGFGRRYIAITIDSVSTLPFFLLFIFPWDFVWSSESPSRDIFQNMEFIHYIPE